MRRKSRRAVIKSALGSNSIRGDRGIGHISSMRKEQNIAVHSAVPVEETSLLSADASLRKGHNIVLPPRLTGETVQQYRDRLRTLREDFLHHPIPAWKTGHLSWYFEHLGTARPLPPPLEQIPPALWDICNGCILWLPSESEIYDDSPSAQLSHIHPAAFNHPIVVLRIDLYSPSDATITFATVCSFNNRRVTPAAAPHLASRCLPVWPTSQIPGDTAQLFLELHHRARWTAAGNIYIYLSNPTCIDWKHLTCLSSNSANAFRLRLTKQSFELVINRLRATTFDISSQEWVQTNRLWTHFIKTCPQVPSLKDAQRAIRSRKEIKDVKAVEDERS